MRDYDQKFGFGFEGAIAYDAPPDYGPLGDLKPTFRAKVENILIELEQQGWEPRVHEDALRTPAQQAAKQAAGVSKTLNSAHLKGYGADIIDRRWAWGGPARSNDFRFWHELGAAAGRQQVDWGLAMWGWDPAHVEMPGWGTLP